MINNVEDGLQIIKNNFPKNPSNKQEFVAKLKEISTDLDKIAFDVKELNEVVNAGIKFLEE
jgi:hypothetical protein